MRVGLIGIGEMGSGCARRLIAQGYEVSGYDPDPARAEAARQAGVSVLADPAAVAKAADSVVILIVGTVEHAEAACLGPSGCLPEMSSKVLVVMSSLNPDAVQRLEKEAEARGGLLVDATMGSGQIQAGEGSMLVMVSGKPAATAAALPVISELADRPEIVGDWVGAAQVMKLITQITLNVNMVAMVESLRIANHFGLDRRQTVQVVGRSPGASYVSEHWRMLAEVMKPHNVGNNHKDLRAAARLAAENDIETPGLAAAMNAFRHEWPVDPGEFSYSGD
jgi:3-hydroxyisobutyrate dehydrogenase-like beta-hydroxyacid dehydrogenase